jgi:cobalamin-dependent methionine synthase I
VDEELFKDQQATLPGTEEAWSSCFTHGLRQERSGSDRKRESPYWQKRSYDILLKEVRFTHKNTVFEPNVLTIGTGMEEHVDYGSY